MLLIASSYSVLDRDTIRSPRLAHSVKDKLFGSPEVLSDVFTFHFQLTPFNRLVLSEVVKPAMFGLASVFLGCVIVLNISVCSHVFTGFKGQD